MEENKHMSENPPSSPPPTKKIKLDSNEAADESKTDPPASDEPVSVENKDITTESSESKKHPAEDVNDSSVPCKKLKQDDTLTVSTESKKENVVEDKQDIATQKKEDNLKASDGSVSINPVTVTPSVEDNKAANTEAKPEKAASKPESAKMPEETKSEKEKEVDQSQANDQEKTIENKEICSVNDAKPPSAVTKSPEVKDLESKPEAKLSPVKILKKLPGLNPIRPLAMGAPLHVSTDMAAPANRATVSTVQVSLGRNPTSPGSSRPRTSPSKQVGGATLSPVTSISPVRNKSPIAQLQRVGGLTVSPVKQKSPQGALTISPVRQARNEVDMSPFLSGEVTISALKQQGLSITPAKPQLSAEIRSQIPEGISITAVPSSPAKSPLSAAVKAKSPVRQNMPKPQKVSPPKPLGQQIRPQAQPIRKPVPARPASRNALPEPGMIGRIVRTPTRQPAPKLLENKSPATGEHLKKLLSAQKTTETFPPKTVNKEEKPAVQEKKPDAKAAKPAAEPPKEEPPNQEKKPEAKADKPAAEPSKEKPAVVQEKKPEAKADKPAAEPPKEEPPKPIFTPTKPKTKTPEPTVKPDEKSNEGNKMDVSTEHNTDKEKTNKDHKMDISAEDKKTNKEKPDGEKIAEKKVDEKKEVKKDEKKPVDEKSKEDEDNSESSSEEESEDDKESEEENSKGK